VKRAVPPRPIGEYLHVIDIDPASDCCYAPWTWLSRICWRKMAWSRPRATAVHQQMVYAVSLTTIRNFERALSGPFLVAASLADQRERKGALARAIRAAPADSILTRCAGERFLWLADQALLFGYFQPLPPIRATIFPAASSLPASHDIIAHETTHALLDGMHRRFQEASNPDVLAFHEAFADIVALFQHFSMPAALRHQIAKTRGDLATENLLLQLAQEFGQATESHAALRDALGEYKANVETQSTRPDGAGSGI
jgi:hypothetical protein